MVLMKRKDRIILLTISNDGYTMSNLILYQPDKADRIN